MANTQSRSLSIFILMFLTAFQGLSGILGGVFLVFDPSGKTIHLPVNWLNDSPFYDYFFPGLILLIVLGLYPLALVYGLWRRKQWSWYGSLFLGIALLIWILVEILIIGYQPEPPLQFIYGVVGILILIVVFLPSVRRFYLNTP